MPAMRVPISTISLSQMRLERHGSYWDFPLTSNGWNGEGFRVPAGVRKPLMQEPAGRS
jgi:hypothetical protein